MDMRLYKIVDTATGEQVAQIRVKSSEVPEVVESAYHLEEVESAGLTLDELKELYKRQVNDFAGIVRARFLYVGYGQTMTYLEREREAAEFKAGGYSGSEKDFPFVYRIATATGRTPKGVCDEIIARGKYWRDKGSTLEAQRERGMLKIDNAADATGADAEKNIAIGYLDKNRP